MKKKWIIIFSSIIVTVLGVLSAPIVYNVVKTPKIQNLEVSNVNDMTETFSLSFDVDKKIDDLKKVIICDEEKNEFSSISADETKGGFFSTSFFSNFNVPFDSCKNFFVSEYINNKGQRKAFSKSDSFEITYRELFSLESVTFGENFDYCDSKVEYKVKINVNRKYTPENIKYSFNGEEGSAPFETGRKIADISIDTNAEVFDFKIVGVEYTLNNQSTLFPISYSSIIDRESYKKDLIQEISFPNGIFEEEETNLCSLRLSQSKYGLPSRMEIIQDNITEIINVSSKSLNNFHYADFDCSAKERLEIKKVFYDSIEYPVSFSSRLTAEKYVNERLFSLLGSSNLYDGVDSSFTFFVGRKNSDFSLQRLSLGFAKEGNESIFECNVSDFQNSSGNLTVNESDINFKNFIENNNIKRDLDELITVSTKNIVLSYKGISYNFENTCTFECTVKDVFFTFVEGSSGFNYSGFSNGGITSLLESEKPKMNIEFSLVTPTTFNSPLNFSYKYVKNATPLASTYNSEVTKNITANFYTDVEPNYSIKLLGPKNGAVEYRIKLHIELESDVIYASFDFANQPQNQIISGKNITLCDSFKNLKLKTDYVFSISTIQPNSIKYYDENSMILDTQTKGTNSVIESTLNASDCKMIKIFLPASYFKNTSTSLFTSFGTIQENNYSYSYSKEENELCVRCSLKTKTRPSDISLETFSMRSYSNFEYSFEISDIFFKKTIDISNETLNDFNFIFNPSNESQILLVPNNAYRSFLSSYGTHEEGGITKNNLSPTKITISGGNHSCDFVCEGEDYSNNIIFKVENGSSIPNTFIGKITKITWDFKNGKSESQSSTRILANRIDDNLDVPILGDDFASDYVEFYSKIFYTNEFQADADEYWHTPFRLKEEYSNNTIYEKFFTQFLKSIKTVECHHKSNGSKKTIFSRYHEDYNPNRIYTTEYCAGSSLDDYDKDYEGKYYKVIRGTIRLSGLNRDGYATSRKITITYFRPGDSTQSNYQEYTRTN